MRGTLMFTLSARDSEACFTLVEGNTFSYRLFTANCGAPPLIAACALTTIKGREISPSIGSSAEEPVTTYTLFGEGRGLFLASTNEPSRLWRWITM